MKSLAVIIPTYNEQTNIALLLADIRRQTRQPDELIVADAHSTDKTREIAAQFGATVVDGGLPGPGRNAGAAVAKSDNLIFFDADVRLFDSAFLEKAAQEFEERDLIAATADLIPMTKSRSLYLIHIFYNVQLRRRTKKHQRAAGSFIMSKKAAHDQISGFDERILLAEDGDYVERLAKIGKFDLLDSVEINVSVRRMVRDGLFTTAFKYLYTDFHMIWIGPMIGRKVKYDFGYDENNRPPEDSLIRK